MNLLVTTSHSLLRVDGESGRFEPLHRGLGLYFGIATDGHRHFVAARGRMVSSDVAREDERGRILVFDAAFALVDELRAPFPLRDMHEILWHDGRLWITCSFDNMVAILDLASGRWERWFPLGMPDPPGDVHHINSLAVIDGVLWIVAHNWGASELVGFDPVTLAPRRRIALGCQAHNARLLRPGVLLTCSSAEGRLVAEDGWELQVGGFPRGLLLTPRERYVGISEILERKERDLSTGQVRVFDADWRPLRDLALPAEGLLLDITAFPETA